MNSTIKLDETTNNNEAVIYLKTSKLGNLFISSVSEISFNGKDLFVYDVVKGRSKLQLFISNEEAYLIIKHLADISGKAFNNLNPILDISFGNFRLNAIHDSVANSNNLGVTNFIIRQIFKGIRITPSQSNLPKPIDKLLKQIILKNQSIIISGITGSGKTELQKYIVSLLAGSQRLIMIEDTYETHIKELFPNLDINVWLLNNLDNSQNQINDLIRAGLRNNPDWLMLAEARGNETAELLLTATSGIPIITTLHAQSALTAIERMIQLIGSKSRFNEQYLEKEIASHIHFFIHMSKDIENSKIKRSISQIIVCYVKNNKVVRTIIYDQSNHVKYRPLDLVFAKQIGLKVKWFET